MSTFKLINDDYKNVDLNIENSIIVIDPPFNIGYHYANYKDSKKEEEYYNELDNYLQGEKGTDIHINDLEIFDKPKELSEFKSYKKNIVNTKINGMVFETELDNSLIKAPQSWCYVEVI